MKKVLETRVAPGVAGGFAGFICFGVYLTTMAPGLSFIDSGELAAVASTLGIAHPTGYPLFAILGRSVLMIPAGLDEILLLNLFAALVTSLAVVFFFSSAFQFQKLVSGTKGRVAGETRPTLFVLIPPLLGSLLFGLSKTVWSQSVVIEVYGLHLLLLLMTLTAFLKAVERYRTEPSVVPRSLFLASFLLGLGFTNHMTTLLIVPAILFLYSRIWGFRRNGMGLLAKLSLPFVAGLSVYSYLPIRAGVHPPLDWGHAASAETFFRHVSGKQYRSWIFSGFESAEKQFRYFINNLPEEFSWIAIILMLLGLFSLLNRNREWLYFLGIAFFTCLFYSVNYDIHDIDSYFLLAYVVLGFILVAGIAWLVNRSGTMAAFAVVLAIMLLPVWQFAEKRQIVDQSDNTLTDDYTMNILNNLAPNAVVFSYQWDFFVSPALYHQIVRKVRPDVTILDKELFRRSWYFIHLEQQAPWLMDRSREKVGLFLRELVKFENDLPYHPQVIEMAFVGMINDFIDKTMEDRPVYVGGEIESEFGPMYKRIPSGLLFRLARQDDKAPVEKPQIYFKNARFENEYTRLLKSKYVQMLSLTAIHLRESGKRQDATELLEKAIEIEPTFQPARHLLQQIQPAAEFP